MLKISTMITENGSLNNSWSMILRYKYTKHRINIYDHLWLKIYQQNIIFGEIIIICIDLT